MQYSENILIKVRDLGASQLSPEDIVALLHPDDEKAFLSDLADTNSVLHAVYQGAFLIAENQSLGIFLAKIQLDTAQLEFDQLEHENKIYKELFGL
jgi:hypothetical protein